MEFRTASSGQTLSAGETLEVGRWGMSRSLTALGVVSVGALLGIYSLAVARDEPAFSYAGASAAGTVALVGAGWALIGCGLAFWVRRPGSRFGPLLAAAGFAWFLPEWNNPGVGSPLVFTVGLALYAACPPLVAHAVLAYPGGRLASRIEAGVIAVAYIGGLLVLGVLPALVFDPQAEGCGPCPANLLLVSDQGRLAEDLYRAGVYAGLGWALALSLLAVVNLMRASSARRSVLAAGAVYFMLVAATFAVWLDRGFLSNGTLERRLWLGQAAALVAVVLGIVWSWVRARRARSTVARLVVELAQSPPPGGLRGVLAEIVGDPDLLLAYPLGDPAGPVDADGRLVEFPAGRETTSLVRDGHTVALLVHSPGLLADEQLVEEVTAAARLALENERLQAEVRARLEQLQASRARIVEAGDTERKRLERDLHDGAQQRLVGLSLSLRLLRSRCANDAGGATTARLDEAELELRRATVELRELAHGIFPAVLADEGLAAAVEALAEEGRVPIQISSLPESRFDAPIETAAYTVVAEAARTATDTIVVGAKASTDTLVIEVETHDGDALDVVALEDRVGALDGRLFLQRREDDQVTIRAELPCGS
jgi:signal transduction histidine kinase